ncbi:hypothetical protein CB1_001112012 [Camelus ferus]|nr:hypothetical protein CB1_001112012 [Camelus ferus]
MPLPKLGCLPGIIRGACGACSFHSCPGPDVKKKTEEEDVECEDDLILACQPENPVKALDFGISESQTGVISIPLYIPHTLFDWKFGDEICAFWLIVDYLLCTASVYNIVLISFDRYQSVSNAVSYRTQHMGILKIMALMAAIWVGAFLVHGPIILVSESWKDEKQDCEPGFFSECNENSSHFKIIP